MQVPFLDLKWQHSQIKENLKVRWDKILENTAFVMGEETKLFEENFAKYCDTKFCIGVSSGTDALTLAMKALDLPKGSEVITLSTSFIASASSIIHAGLIPKFSDADLSTGNYDFQQLEKNIGPNTKAIMAVHLYGRMCDMDKILEIAKKHNLKVIEDSAQAHGAKYKGKVAGSMGDIACFSFYPGKNLGAYGQAGAVVTNSEILEKKVRRYRDHGSLGKYDHEILGHNNKIDNIQTSVLDEKLKHLDRWNILRREIANKYFDRLGHLEKSGKILFISPNTGDTESVHHIFPILINNRDDVMAKLKELGVSTNIHYPTSLPSLKLFSDFAHIDECPTADRISREILSLPMYPGMTDEQVDHVINSLQSIL